MHHPTPFLAQPVKADAELPPKIKIVLAYENLSAALWATEAFTVMLRQSPDGPKTQLIPWSFSTLSNPDFSAQATDVAAQADLIVIATSSNFRLLPAFLENWLGKCLSGKRGPQTAVAALFGRANRPERSDSMRLRAVQELAEKAGCRFLAPFVTDGI